MGMFLVLLLCKLHRATGKSTGTWMRSLSTHDSPNLVTDSPTFEVNIFPSCSPTNGAGTVQQFVHSHGDDLVTTHHRTNNTKDQHHEYICTNVLTCTPHMSLAEHEAHSVKRILRCLPPLLLG